MRVYKEVSAQFLYRQQLRDLLTQGEEVIVKGGRKTLELLDVATVIAYPQQRLHLVPGRRASPWLALSESLWLLTGRNDLAALEPYNKRIREFSDDGETLYGAYGYRIRGQIQEVIERLEKDPTDRRAVLVIWEDFDLIVETKDSPCNDIVFFKLRDGRLHMTVCCRSNDLHFGLYAVNLCQFSFLQEYIATRLRVGMGTQTHISNSLHIYRDGPQEEITKRMLRCENEPYSYSTLSRRGLLFPVSPMQQHDFLEDCSAVLDGEFIVESFPLPEFACDFLQVYREKDWKALPHVRHADHFSDWIAVAQEFINFPSRRET